MCFHFSEKRFISFQANRIRYELTIEMLGIVDKMQFLLWKCDFLSIRQLFDHHLLHTCPIIRYNTLHFIDGMRIELENSKTWLSNNGFHWRQSTTTTTVAILTSVCVHSFWIFEFKARNDSKSVGSENLIIHCLLLDVCCSTFVTKRAHYA